LAKDDLISESLKILELAGYWVFYRPQLFWFVFRLPQIFWNLSGNKLKALAEYFTVDFPLHKVSKLRKSVGHAAFYRLEEEIEGQREKASFYWEALKEAKGIKVIKESLDTRATYPYLTLIFDEPRRRDKAWEALGNSGLGVSRIYAYPIGEYDYLKEIIPQKDSPGGHYLAERQITLSTSAFLKKEDLYSIVKAIKNL
jgi:dTDP-4-amino-4,6-dideoxygalactose transaminase